MTQNGCAGNGSAISKGTHMVVAVESDLILVLVVIFDHNCAHQLPHGHLLKTGGRRGRRVTQGLD